MRRSGRLVCLSGLGAASLWSAASAAPSDDVLIGQWRRENTLCRGLSGDDPLSGAACEKRQAIGRRLAKRGWCYGKQNQMAYQMQWHRCSADSLRPE